MYEQSHRTDTVTDSCLMVTKTKIFRELNKIKTKMIASELIKTNIKMFWKIKKTKMIA